MAHSPEGAIEIDGATNNGVDHVRHLLEKAATLNVYKKKVIIIDEAHMMSKAAFNAMLVTLENPPAHCIFIICTTEAEALPPTITSRMPVYTFGKIPDTLVKEHVQKVALKNNIKISSDAAGLISRYANGAMRNALQLLEQLSKQKTEEETVEAEDVVLTLGLSSLEQQAKFLEACLSGDIRTAIEVLKTCENTGISLKTFLRDVLSMNTDLLLLKSGAEVVGTAFYLSNLKALCEHANTDIVQASRILTAAVSGHGNLISVERVATEIAASFYSRADGEAVKKETEEMPQKSIPVEEKKEPLAKTQDSGKGEEDSNEDTCNGFRSLTCEDESPFEKPAAEEEPAHTGGIFSGLFSGLNLIGRTGTLKHTPQSPGLDKFEKDKTSKQSLRKDADSIAKEKLSISGGVQEEKAELKEMGHKKEIGNETPLKEFEDMPVDAAKTKPVDSNPPHGEKRMSWNEMAKRGVLPKDIFIPVPDSEEDLDSHYEAMECEREEEEIKACSGSILDLENARKALEKLLGDPGFKMLFNKARYEECNYGICLYYNKAVLVDAMKAHLTKTEGITALLETGDS